MSGSQKTSARAARGAADEDGADRDASGRSTRFTPLRSYVTRARVREASGESVLSRLIPVPSLKAGEAA